MILASVVFAAALALLLSCLFGDDLDSSFETQIEWEFEEDEDEEDES